VSEAEREDYKYRGEAKLGMIGKEEHLTRRTKHTHAEREKE